MVAKLLEVHAGLVRGAAVCDLSAGTGLVGAPQCLSLSTVLALSIEELS